MKSNEVIEWNLYNSELGFCPTHQETQGFSSYGSLSLKTKFWEPFPKKILKIQDIPNDLLPLHF